MDYYGACTYTAMDYGLVRGPKHYFDKDDENSQVLGHFSRHSNNLKLCKYMLYNNPNSLGHEKVWLRSNQHFLILHLIITIIMPIPNLQQVMNAVLPLLLNNRVPSERLCVLGNKCAGEPHS